MRICDLRRRRRKSWALLELNLSSEFGRVLLRCVPASIISNHPRFSRLPRAMMWFLMGGVVGPLPRASSGRSAIVPFWLSHTTPEWTLTIGRIVVLFFKRSDTSDCFNLKKCRLNAFSSTPSTFTEVSLRPSVPAGTTMLAWTCAECASRPLHDSNLIRYDQCMSNLLLPVCIQLETLSNQSSPAKNDTRKSSRIRPSLGSERQWITRRSRRDPSSWVACCLRSGT